MNILLENQIKDKLNFLESYSTASNPATGSIVDANSNVTEKSLATAYAELYKDYNIQLNRKLSHDKIEEMYGTELAEKYLEDLQDHLIYVNDESSLFSYCASVSLYPFLLEGTKCLGGVSDAPKNLQSFCGSFVNCVYQIASSLAGAVATVEFLHLFDYFARKQYGKDYLKTNAREVNQELQGVVYALNQPASARGNQSVFWNISVLDKYYMKAMFGDFFYPDGTQVDFDSVMELQKFFMGWFRKEREKSLLTFPVLTASCIEKEDLSGFKDEEFVDFLCEEMSKGLSFFIYESTSADSLSSCCFDGSQMTLTKSSNGINYMTFEDLYNASYNETKRNFTIFHNGSWVKGKIIKLTKNNHKMYKVITVNNKEMILSDNHLNYTLAGDIRTDCLTTDDYILFNTEPLESFPEKDKHYTYEQGILIGAYLGDGSRDMYQVNLSLNKEKYNNLVDCINKAVKEFGVDTVCVLGKQYNNVYPVRICSKEMSDIVGQFVTGKYCNEKELNMDVLLQNKDFRKGIIDGFMLTDGGNSNRMYTTSKVLAEQIEVIMTSLGLVSIINVVDRTDEKVVIRGKEYNRNYPLYCIRYYDRKNKRTMKGVYKVINNQTFFKVKSIEEINTDSNDIYCFEMLNQDEPYFTLPNGVITHNCRLRNEITENDFSYTLGAGGVMTGSVQVITLNANRLVQKYGLEELPNLISRMHKYLTAYRAIYKHYIDLDMLPPYSAGFITLDKQFITIGVNGIIEAAEYLGYDISPNSDYIKFCADFLGTIKDLNTAYKQETGIKVNTEIIPAENLGVKNAKWDKQDGLKVNRDCFNSYFYKVEDENTTILDKFILHGRTITNYLDGGSALHINIEHLLTKEQAKKMFMLALKNGVPYWTFNCKMTCCNDCGYIDVNTNKKCSKCGSENVDYATRVIGYLKKISNFSEKRQEEAKRRFYA